MTLLGVPSFSIGTSSSTAPASSESQMDMSLDDMIKSRRKSRSSTRRRSVAAARKPTAADKATGKARASRAAKIQAKRGISNNVQGKPSAMEIERQVYRQTRMNTGNQQQQQQSRKPAAARSRKQSAAQIKARKTEQQRRAQKNKGTPNKNGTPPTWVSGTRRPPSKKAVNAAVKAMTNSGYKIPQGMQMVISFAPAPDSTPPTSGKKSNKGTSSHQKSGNKGKQNKGGGGKK